VTKLNSQKRDTDRHPWTSFLKGPLKVKRFCLFMQICVPARLKSSIVSKSLLIAKSINH